MIAVVVVVVAWLLSLAPIQRLINGQTPGQVVEFELPVVSPHSCLRQHTVPASGMLAMGTSLAYSCTLPIRDTKHLPGAEGKCQEDSPMLNLDTRQRGCWCNSTNGSLCATDLAEVRQICCYEHMLCCTVQLHSTTGSHPEKVLKETLPAIVWWMGSLVYAVSDL
jgi:hypothetical protein